MAITHGRNGWQLLDYSWDPDTGIGTFVYEREREDFDATEQKTVIRLQPAHPSHTGWLAHHFLA